MFNSKQLRQKYIEFFKSKNHEVVETASLIPVNDPTVLFTTAGMHPLVPNLLGEKHPAGKRLASVQKCVRLQDIDEVGDNCHDTFFEMLGNWSLGDYFKKEAIEWSWEFLTSPKYLGLNPKKMAVSVFNGDENDPRDEESAKIWKSLGVAEHKIVYLPKENNWWDMAGQAGPCGPDTEIFYWKGDSKFPLESNNPKDDEENWLEIWNNVFMQYNKTTDGFCEPLKQKNVDTGMGLERTLMVLNKYADVFQVDTFWPLIQKIQEISGHEYIENENITRSMRIIADHVRTAVMIMSDDKGVAPSNTDQGYVVRRLIRRAVRHGRLLEIKENFCTQVAEKVINIFADVYSEVVRNKPFVITELAKEESKFRNTIEQGLKEFEKLVNGFRLAFEKTGQLVKQISGNQAFKLYDTYGFPLEMTQELAVENGLSVDNEGFQEAFKKHQELSRFGAEQKFKGGLADKGEMSVKYHTATHLLHAALKKVLGNHVEQRGSNITAERLRFDFSHPEKMTEEQKNQVEELVNYAIKRDYSVSWEEMILSEAKKRGATGLFENQYNNQIKVYSVGDSMGDPDAHINSLTFSKEICGGPHVEHTGALGKFKIIKEEAVGAGVRRIKAILE